MVGSRVVADPPLARFLFADPRLAPLWLVVQLYIGYARLDVGWHKIMDTGAATNYIIDGKGSSRAGRDVLGLAIDVRVQDGEEVLGGQWRRDRARHG